MKFPAELHLLRWRMGRRPAVVGGGTAVNTFLLYSLLLFFLNPFSHSKSPNINPRFLDLKKSNKRKRCYLLNVCFRFMPCCCWICGFVMLAALVWVLADPSCVVRFLVVLAGLCCTILLVPLSVCFAGIYREGFRLRFVPTSRKTGL